MYTLLKQRRMRWLGHVARMEDGRIPKDLLYGELAQGKRPTGRPQLRYKDICKWDMTALGINSNTWETSPADRSTIREEVTKGLSTFEGALASSLRPIDNVGRLQPIQQTLCSLCQRDCHSRIGLVSHTRRCPRPTSQNAGP